eukprot:TRINITY_DN2532_c0_g1_i5.p2 TRINITY_DN2532_c0_g1~~TRINITY_DN2532_c0_g1_i5.p2  ORF type:complete len:133 (-),score=10.78 TRINITY_DN2532_c0_g1_i5:229-627(-)
MMRTLFVCVAVIAFLATYSHADTAFASSQSSASLVGGHATAYTHDYTHVQGGGQAYANGFAQVVTPTCLVTADTDAFSIILANCGIIIANAFSAAFAGGQVPFAVVHTWAIENGFTCTAISDAGAFADAFGC